MSALLTRLRTYASFVRISHSVFALPLALAGAMLAARRVPPTTDRVMWIIVAMVAARSAAMGFNRLVDARFDALNPRTASREIPSGKMSPLEAAAFVAVSAMVFVGAAWALGPICFWLSPVALAIVFWYSLAKRYTWSAQAFLGASRQRGDFEHLDGARQPLGRTTQDKTDRQNFGVGPLFAGAAGDSVARRGAADAAQGDDRATAHELIGIA